MPSNVAVQEPDAGVVGAEGDGDVAGAGQEGDVAAGRVFVVEFSVGEVGCVEGDGLLGEDYEVVAVEVDLGGCCQLGVVLGGGEGRGEEGLTGWDTGKNFRELICLETEALAVMIR